MDLKPGEKYNIQETSPGLCKHMPKKHHGDKVAGYHQQHRLVEKDQQQPLEITIRTRGRIWLGHTPRKSNTNISRQTLEWNQQ